MEGFDFPATGNRALDELIGRLKRALSSLAKAVTNDVLVPAAVATTDTRVYHKLPRAPVTWEVVGRDGPGVVYESATENTARDRYLLLKASTAVNVTIRFS